MNSIDKNYLSLQFRLAVLQKDSTGFQTFFENIANKAFSGFTIIHPYGKKGDGGNDGYVKDTGTYYQAYSPINPEEKDADAAKKFKKDFDKLKSAWSSISEVKTYNFVFNDKYRGSNIELESALSELEKENPGVKFFIFTADELEKAFLSLSLDEIQALGFNVDSRNTLSNVKDYFEKLSIELDRNNTAFAYKSLQNIKDTVTALNDEALLLEYEILESRALQRLERIPEAKAKYESLILRYPTDPRATLYLSEIYLNDEDFDKNQELLQQAEKIDVNHWLLKIERLIRDYRLDNKIDINTIDESNFPAEPKIKADFYRTYSLFLERGGDTTRSDSFIERAIFFNPNKFNNYDVKLGHLEERFLRSKADKETKKKESDILLKKISEVEAQLLSWGGISPKNQALLNVKKMHIYVSVENYADFEKVVKETFQLILLCYFDYGVDRIICNIIQYVALPEKDLTILFNYLSGVEKPISDPLARMLFLQFMHKGTLDTDGINFYEKNNKAKFVEFINAIKDEDYDKALTFLGDDIQFAVDLAVSQEMPSDFRKKITAFLPDDGTLKKEKLVFIDLYHDKKYPEAFSHLQASNISDLSHIECIPMFEVAKKMKAWDMVIKLGEKLLEFEDDVKSVLQLELELFTANLNLEVFPEVIRIGESILSDPAKMTLLDEENREIMLVQTSYAWFKRGKYPEAKTLIEKYPNLIKKFETKVSVQAEVYLKNSDPEAALNSIIEGVKIKKRPSPEEYGSLFFIFTHIGNLMEYPLSSESEVKEGSFLKIKNQERWLFIGNEDELDATKVPVSNEKLYLGKKVGEKVILETKYSSQKTEQEIELILPIGKYILWQSTHHAQQLSIGGMWDAMKAIEVPTTPEGGIDPKFLLAILEDQNKRGQDFFNTYCEQNLPFAMLAVSEGGLPQAIGRIQNEQRGFIKFSDGTQKEFDEQKKIAESIIEGKEFYIDGTSALILSETGLLKKIEKFLPNIKSPQSVISLLLELTEKFTSSPGQVGHMFYSKGKIGFTDIDASKHAEIKQNFLDAIGILESKQKTAEVISLANKSDKFSEQDIAPCLSDATILAQKNGVPVLTEDFLYLHMNELETSKPKPLYCSALAIVRVLYEQGKLDFTEYLNFFGYLSSYRFRFLQISIEDMEKAVFGDGKIKVIDEKGLRKLNIGLTLSEEYGVPQKTSHSLIVRFVIKMLVDDSAPTETAEKVFEDIVNTFPTKQDRQLFGRSLVIASVQLINRGLPVVVGAKVQEKIDALTRYIQMYDASKNIIKL